MRLRHLARLAAAIAGLGLAAPTPASLGPYEHGAGIKSQGAGGISYAFGEESTVISANPAIAAALDPRNDVGVSLFLPTPVGEIEGNLFGRAERHVAKGQRIYPIPQGGLIRHLSPTWSFGAALFSAGLGPDYQDSPYQRFGGAPRASLTLISSAVNLPSDGRAPVTLSAIARAITGTRWNGWVFFGLKNHRRRT